MTLPKQWQNKVHHDVVYITQEEERYTKPAHHLKKLPRASAVLYEDARTAFTTSSPSSPAEKSRPLHLQGTRRGDVGDSDPLSYRAVTTGGSTRKQATNAQTAIKRRLQIRSTESSAGRNTARGGGEHPPPAAPLSNKTSKRQLYGREMEQHRLSEIYRKGSSSVEVIFISGPSGTGKTSLAMSLGDKVHLDGGFFASGKCQLLQNQRGCMHNHNSTKAQQLEPYGPFIAALSDFFEQVAHFKQQRMMEPILQEVCDTLSEYELHILQSIIPRMSDVTMREHDENDGVVVLSEEGESTTEKEEDETKISVATQKNPKIVRLAFRRLLRSLAGNKDHPLVLCLDDIQWADNASIELLHDIIKLSKSEEAATQESSHSEEGGRLMIVACFREEEKLRFDFDMLFRIGDIRNGASCQENKELAARTRETTRVTRIRVGALSLDSLAEMASSQLGLTKEESLPLAKLIYHQSKGNAFMVHHSLRALQNKEKSALLKEAALPQQSENNAMNGEGNYIIQLMVSMLQKLPVETTKLLTVASCLHTEFSAKLLHQATYHDPTNDRTDDINETIYAALKPAIEKGLISDRSQNNEAIFRFCHDKVQEAAYSLIRLKEDEKKFLLEVGRKLQSNFTNHEMVKNIFLLTKLLSPGVDLMYTEEERENLIVLCLAAGRQATRSSSFATALEYIEFGISLLGRRNWRDQYELSLELYNAASELSYCTGNHDRVDELVESVLCNAKSFEDEMQAHRSKILSLGSRGEYSMACELGFDLLRKLGHPMSSQAGALRIKMELWRTQRKLRKLSVRDIMNLKRMSNTKALECMSILHLLHPIIAFANKLGLVAIISIRLVNLTLQHGICSLSSVGFALYGLTLARLGRGDDGYRYGMVAFQLLDKLKARELAAKTRLSMALGGQAMKEPFRKAVNSMLVAHDLGMRTGDLETSIRSLTMHAVIRMYMGDSLPKVSSVFGKFDHMCSEYGQNDTAATRGWNDAHLFLSGKRQDFPGKEELQACIDGRTSRPPGVYVLCGWFYVATYMNDIEFSKSLVTVSRKLNYDFSWMAPALYLFHTFYEATVELSLILYQSGPVCIRKRNRINQRVEKLCMAAKHCPQNMWNKIYLLEADLALVSKNYDRAQTLYGKSIKFAKQEGFVNEEALAYEKIGRMEMLRNRESEARCYLSKSFDLYEQWGAKVKTAQIGEIISQISTKQ